MKRYLVTGAAGFIGNQIALELLERGELVCGIDNLNDYYDVSLKKARLKRLQSFENFSFEKGNIANTDWIQKVCKAFQPERIAHMAAQAGVRYSLTNPETYVSSNLVGFCNLLEVCRNLNIENFVYASSSSVYGANSKMPFSEHDSTEHPVSLYAATKKSNEMMAHSYSYLYGVPMTGLRFFTVYGPWGRPDMATVLFTKKILKGEPIDVFNNGHHKRDFTYITDIVKGVLRVLDQPTTPNQEWVAKKPDPASSPAPYRIYNIGNHSPVLLSDFIETLEDVIGKKAIKNFKEIQPGDVPDTFADCSNLKNDFGYHPETPIRQGLESFYQWYSSYYK